MSAGMRKDTKMDDSVYASSTKETKASKYSAFTNVCHEGRAAKPKSVLINRVNGDETCNNGSNKSPEILKPLPALVPLNGSPSPPPLLTLHPKKRLRDYRELDDPRSLSGLSPYLGLPDSPHSLSKSEESDYNSDAPIHIFYHQHRPRNESDCASTGPEPSHFASPTLLSPPLLSPLTGHTLPELPYSPISNISSSPTITTPLSPRSRPPEASPYQSNTSTDTTLGSRRQQHNDLDVPKNTEELSPIFLRGLSSTKPLPELILAPRHQQESAQKFPHNSKGQPVHLERQLVGQPPKLQHRDHLRIRGTFQNAEGPIHSRVPEANQSGISLQAERQSNFRGKQIVHQENTEIISVQTMKAEASRFHNSAFQICSHSGVRHAQFNYSNVRNAEVNQTSASYQHVVSQNEDKHNLLTVSNLQRTSEENFVNHPRNPTIEWQRRISVPNNHAPQVRSLSLSDVPISSHVLLNGNQPRTTGSALENCHSSKLLRKDPTQSRVGTAEGIQMAPGILHRPRLGYISPSSRFVPYHRPHQGPVSPTALGNQNTRMPTESVQYGLQGFTQNMLELPKPQLSASRKQLPWLHSRQEERVDEFLRKPISKWKYDPDVVDFIFAAWDDLKCTSAPDINFAVLSTMNGEDLLKLDQEGFKGISKMYGEQMYRYFCELKEKSEPVVPSQDQHHTTHHLPMQPLYECFDNSTNSVIQSSHIQQDVLTDSAAKHETQAPYEFRYQLLEPPRGLAFGENNRNQMISAASPTSASKIFEPFHAPTPSSHYSSTMESLSDPDQSCNDEEPKPEPPKKRGPGRPRKPENELKRKKKTGRLWEFIRNLLLDPETCPSLVKWENAEEGIFRFVQAEKVAQRWGDRKKNKEMNYEKLSRAMRYYYKGGVFEAVLGRRLVYKFGKNAKNWKPSNPNFQNPV